MVTSRHQVDRATLIPAAETARGVRMTARVLIIDDEPTMCEMLADALALRGHETAWRLSAEQAYQLLEERGFDVVITDLNMNGMNGLELCERVAANHPDVPVIVVTAYGSMESAVAAIRAARYRG